MPNKHPSTPFAGSVRASRDGHTYHDTWAARVSLQLLDPQTTLAALAMEGFGPRDQASQPAHEIADVVLYHGAPLTKDATHIHVVQLKYSLARATTPAPFSYVSPTLTKFSQIYRDDVKHRAKRHFEFVCNRPVGTDLLGALEALRAGTPATTKTVKATIAKIRAATKLQAADLADFARRLVITPTAGSIAAVAHDVRHTIASWSDPSTAGVRHRFLGLLQLLHDKAGGKGAPNNLIQRVDVLTALEIEDEKDLFPTPPAFPAVHGPLERPVIAEIEAATTSSSGPILLHAPAGGGKTVIMQMLAERLAKRHVVLLFDGFGGGRWRDPADARHLARRAITHIANTLACDHGLCDILIPTQADDDHFIRAFRLRLEDAVRALRAKDADARVVILLDAIDHAGMAARAATHERSFAHLLLHSLAATPISGVVIVASCRPERRDDARGSVTCHEIAVPPLTKPETRALVAKAGLADEGVIALLHTRSAGNPRMLDALIRETKQTPKSRRAKPAATGADLDSLLTNTLETAIAEATKRGSGKETRTFLTALALLPPPVPAAELALAFHEPQDAVLSLVTDLFPLIENTASGLIFRDEPTETLVRERYRADPHAIQRVTTALSQAQERSPYAAQALPHLLAELGQIDQLLQLAFDPRVPQLGSARFGEREIRLARVVAALRVCVAEERTGDIFGLMLEAARLASSTQRSDKFLLDHPELAALSRDPATHRRLEELRGYWPVLRHAALTISYALTGDQGEATRHGRRTWDWLVAPEPQRDIHSPQERTPRNLDWAATMFAATLNGNAKGVVNWLTHVASRDPVRAFAYMSALADLLLINDRAAKEHRSIDELIAASLAGGPHALPLLVALLTRFPDQGSALLKRSMKRLATLAKRATTLQKERSWRDTDFTNYQDALLHIAMRVLRSGDPNTARHLRKCANVGRLDSYRHRGEPHYDNVTRIVIAAAIDVAADCRCATLSDLAPSDLHDVVVALAKGSSPEHYEQAVKEALKEPERSKAPETQATKPKFSYEERQRVSDLLSHRIRKLIPLVDALASLMRAPSSATDPVAEMIGHIETNIPEGHSYPFRDDASYFARIGAEAIYASTTALAILDSTAAASLLKFVAKHRFFFLPFRTKLVAALAAQPGTANLAVTSSMAIAEAIASLDDVDSRIEAYADLAHALAPASVHEAQRYIAKAVEAAEGLGSSDYETIQPLVHLIAGTPVPLEQEATHAFNRIAELNFEHDPGKFIWVTMGRALTRASGSAALAQLARWDHRDIAGLSYSLPPFLTSAVALKHLSPDLAAALIGLDEPSGSWDWDFSKFAEAVLPGLSHPQREIAAHIILQEFDRRSGGAPHAEGLDRLRDCYSRHLAGNSPSLARVTDLINALGKSVPAERSRKPKAIDREHEDALAELAAKLDPFDASAIDDVLASHSASDAFRPISLSSLFQAVSKAVTSVDARVTFLDTIIALDQPLEQKLFALDDIADDWIASSNALREHFAIMARKLVRRHADELSEAGWSLDYQLRRLVKLGISRSSIALELIGSLGRSCMEVPGHAWLALASELLPFTGNETVKRALERYLTRSAAAIPDDAAGGPWHVDLSPPPEPAQRVAGLLWSRLGAAEAAGRWRAAHAVRRLGYLQRTDCLDVLVQHFHYSDAGAFGDASTPFFAMHAKVWLVTAFSRLALENPRMGLRYRDVFEGILRDRTAPHAILAHLAAKGLSAVLHLLPQRERAEAKRLIADMAAPPHGYLQVKNYNRPNAYIGAPEGHKREFYFEYDFHKHEIDGLARVFGLPTWQVEGMCAQKVKALAPTAAHYTDTGTPWKKYIDMEEHDAISGSAPRKDLWGTYLSWHALLQTAADLYLSKPVIRNSDDADESPWHEWLSSYLPMLPDGSWRADTTELFPAELIRRHWATPMHDDQKTSPLPEAAEDLAKLIARGSGELPKDWLTIGGSWHSPAGFTARVSSAFIDTQSAEHGAWAVMSAVPHDRWLPMEGDDYGRPSGRAEHPFIPVLGQSYHRGPGLDRRDPYASSRAYPDECPASAIVNACHLQPSELGRIWNEGTSCVMRTRAWGGKKFYARDEQDTEGNDLQCKPEWLTAYLTKHDLALAVLITADWYRRTSSRETERQTKQLLLIVQPSGAVTFYSAAPPQILAIVAAIPTESYDLRVRYKAIVDATSSEIATRAKHRARKKSSAKTTSRGVRRVLR